MLVPSHIFEWSKQLCQFFHCFCLVFYKWLVIVSEQNRWDQHLNYKFHKNEQNIRKGISYSYFKIYKDCNAYCFKTGSTTVKVTFEMICSFAARVSLEFFYSSSQLVLCIDGQGRLVRMQTDNFRLFLCKQTDKQQTSVSLMSKR